MEIHWIKNLAYPIKQGVPELLEDSARALKAEEIER